MKSHLVSLTVAVAFAVAASTLPAMAADPQPGLGGAPVPGVCLLSREAIFANAKVGVAATARLKQLSLDAQTEVDALRKPVDGDIKAYQAEQAKLSPDQRRVRELALSDRLKPVQALANTRAQEIELTRVKAMQTIAGDAQPIIAEVYKAKGCGLLIDRTSVLGGNLSNDLTAAVVQKLDASVTTIAFDREALSEKK